MTHFDGWEDSWASFDDYTVAAFRQKTGLDARRDLKLGDFRDPHFRQWIDFRIDTLTEFMHEIDGTPKRSARTLRLSRRSIRASSARRWWWARMFTSCTT